jgi:hypothetical protein
MIDVNTPILKAYYTAINNLNIPVYEGEEPDDVKDNIYCVLSDVTNIESSTFTSSDTTSTIQISVHSWEYKYNNSYSLNSACSAILSAIKPTSASVLDLSADGLQMTNLTIATDRTERLGELGGKVFITRIIIFKQNIFVIS